MTRRLLIATRNAGKIREFRELLKDCGWQLTFLSDLPGVPEISETGATFRENAEIKAVGYSKSASPPALAEDSGLEVDALGGRPGVRSARFAGEKATDEMNNELLLKSLRGVPFEKRTARYRAVCVLARAGRVVRVTEGTCEGYIAETPRGTAGFGYDPLFFIPSFNRTVAELDLAVKNSISHRARAVANMKSFLAEFAPRTSS